MKRLSTWKLKRELARLGRQALGAHSYLSSYLLSRHYYDLILSKKIRKYIGNMSRSERVAIYLIFPQRGLLPSHLAALDYLSVSGYAPIVVSNLPIGNEEREVLLRKAHLLIERPNFGYDFGGYRDAILTIGSAPLRKLDRLVLLNDSCWFPLPGGMDWLKEAEALGVDYAAAAWHGAIMPQDPEEYEFVDWNIRKNRRNFHYASFALSISNNLLSNNDFFRFWSKFRLTNEKHRTVRRGEIGLTKWVIKHRYSHGSTTELADFDAELHAMSQIEVDNILSRMLLIAEPRMKQKWLDTLGSDGRGLSRAQQEKMILALTAREGMSYALADYLIRARRFAFLKKSPLGEDQAVAKIVTNLVATLPQPERQMILSEIATLYRQEFDAAQKSMTKSD